MNVRKSLLWGIQKIKPIEKAKHGDMAAPDAEILLAFILKKPKEFLYSHPEKKITVRQWNQFKKFIARRAKHEPVAYIINHKEFFGLDFFVNKHVMVPRPETEILVENAFHLIHNRSQRTPRVTPKNANLFIVDVGSGSGCIIISLAKNLFFPSNLFWSDRTKTGYVKKIKFFATEISPGALEVARKNARRHKVTITFLRGNLLEPLIKKIKNRKLEIGNFVITANLPYLTTKQWRHTQPEIKKYEPRLALDGGPDGLKYHRQLFKQIKELVTSYKLQVTSLIEIDPSETKSIKKLIHTHFPTAKIEIKKDLAGRNRIIVLKIKTPDYIYCHGNKYNL